MQSRPKWCDVTWALTHWGRVTQICVSDLTNIGSDNGLPPGRRQAIIWTNAGILLIWPLGTNVSENSIEILTFSFMKMRLKVSCAKWRPFCLGLNVLMRLTSCNVCSVFHSGYSYQVILCEGNLPVDSHKARIMQISFLCHGANIYIYVYIYIYIYIYIYYGDVNPACKSAKPYQKHD